VRVYRVSFLGVLAACSHSDDNPALGCQSASEVSEVTGPHFNVASARSLSYLSQVVTTPTACMAVKTPTIKESQNNRSCSLSFAWVALSLEIHDFSRFFRKFISPAFHFAYLLMVQLQLFPDRYTCEKSGYISCENSCCIIR
jgi:hypothetical protein